ncbi:GNAT family N-acetyltransferase [Tsuneonella sp. HG222]
MATRPAAIPQFAAAAGEVAAPTVRLEAKSWRELAVPDEAVRWEALAEWAAEPNPFYESWYLLPALEAFDPAGRVKLLCLEADGVLAGVMPLARDWTYYGYPFPQMFGWTHPNSFVGTPLVAAGFEKIFWRELLAWADRHAGAALFLHLTNVPLAGPLHGALSEVCRAEGRGLALVKHEERAMLASDLAPEDYFAAALGGKKRKELRRQHNRLAEQGDLQVRRLRGSEGLDQWIAAFLELEARGWKGAQGSAMASSETTKRLFSQALAGAARCGRLERLELTLDGRSIAMLASFLTPPGAFSYKTAFDEDFGRFSPGVLLQRENLDLLERPDIAWCDSCAAPDHPMIDHLWRERRAIGRVSVAIGGPLRRRLFAALARRETRGIEQ